jgi:hypothetical protein
MIQFSMVPSSMQPNLPPEWEAHSRSMTWVFPSQVWPPCISWTLERKLAHPPIISIHSSNILSSSTQPNPPSPSRIFILCHYLTYLHQMDLRLVLSKVATVGSGGRGWEDLCWRPAQVKKKSVRDPVSKASQVWWCTFVIPATQEAEAGESRVQSEPGQS